MNPYILFHDWFKAASKSGERIPEAMTLSTVGLDGKPAARVVLYKGMSADNQQFLFYTNYQSRKGQELERCPYAALTLHWALLERQVRIEGRVSKLSPEQSAVYFHSRPRGSQISAWASQQSQPIASYDELAKKFREFEREFADREIPCPPYWGGYAVDPSVIEFWQGRESRLHERALFERQEDGTWSMTPLAP